MAKNTDEPDEFDRIAQQGGPLGVHRAHRPWWTRVLPILLAFILAGAAAYGLATYYWNQDGGPGDEASPTASPSVIEPPEPSPTPTPSPSITLSPSPEPEPEPVIEFDTSVVVLNAAAIGGLAGSNQEELEAEGFTDVGVGNLTSNQPDASVVVYESEGLADTAARIAEILDVDDTEMGDTRGGGSIDVILTSDPDA